MKATIYCIHSYGYRSIIFRKTFELPFVPFIGLIILDEVEEYEVQIELQNNSYYSTTIMYYPKDNEITVDIRNNWLKGISIETVEETIKNFSNCKWERTDNTDLDELLQFIIKEK